MKSIETTHYFTHSSTHMDTLFIQGFLGESFKNVNILLDTPYTKKHKSSKLLKHKLLPTAEICLSKAEVN